MSKQIQLTQGKVALVDDNMFEELGRYKWYAKESRGTWYAMRQKRLHNGKQRTILMHREILNPPKGMETDHKDGNGLNNQRENLRVATKSQNQHNRKPCQSVAGYTVSSQYKGVYWNKRDHVWVVHIRIKGRVTHLGHFQSEIEAAKAYDGTAKEYFGEYARTNF